MAQNIAVAVFGLWSLVGCALLETSEATHMLTGESYPATSQESVVIYLEKPSFAYLTVGTVEARGIGIDEAKDQELALAALKREAANIGATGVIVTSSEQQIADINQYGTTTERRIKGIAIRKQ